MKHFFTLIALCGFSLFAQTIPTYVPTNGLVGWWPFNGNSSDMSGNGHNGTNYGPVFSSGATNQPNTAILLDGINDYVVIPHHSQLALTGNMTLCARFKSTGFNGQSAYHTILNKRSSGIWPYGMNVSYVAGPNGSEMKRIMSGRRNTSLTADYQFSADSININSWEHWVVTIQNQTVKFYRNGVLNSSSTFTTTATDIGAELLFGRNGLNEGLPEYFRGLIDEIGIWNRALTATEIQTLYFGCTDTLATQPVSVNASLGSNATFTAASSASSATYQWQGKSGNSFVNLSNAGQFSGSTTGTLTVSGVTSANNGSQFRCIVDHGDCVDTSDVAVLTACFDVVNQPVDQYVIASNTATFTATTNDPACTYQWQTNAGFGFQNISNAGQYSGTTSNTLSVASVSAANNNQLFRCLITSGTCKDTTSEAKIILSGVGVNESRLDALTLSPNPTSGTIRFNLPVSGTYRISAPDGRIVETGEMKEILDLGRFPNGVYTIEVQSAQAQRTFRAVKQD